MAGKKGEIPKHVKQRQKEFSHSAIEHPVIKILMEVNDPGQPSFSFRHALTSILFMALIATICGGTDWAKIIDREYLEHPFYGSRRMTEVLKALGYCINRKKVQRLMYEMGLEAI